jgi:PAS domain S-box-containing protein
MEALVGAALHYNIRYEALSMRGLTGKLIWGGIVLAAFYWLLDATLDTIFYAKLGLLDHFLRPQPQELWPRIAVVLTLIVFGLLSHAIYSRSQEALRASEETMRAQYRAIPVPTYTWQMRGGELELVNYNDAAEKFTQGGIKDYLGIKFNEMYKDAPEILGEMAKCFEEQIVIEREMPYQLRSTGEQKHLAVKYAFVPPDSVLVHTEDITVRVLAEKESSRLQERWHSFAENTPVFVLIVDRDGKLLFLNRAAAGHTVEESLGRTIWEFIDPDYHDTARKTIERVFDMGESGSYEAPIESKDSTVWYMTHVGSIKHEGRVVAAMLIATDVTEKKLAQEALQATHATLELHIKKRTIELSTLLEISNSVASARELEVSLGSILQGLKRVIRFGGACIHILESESLVCQSCLGPAGAEIVPEALAVSRFWQSQEIIHRKQTLIVADVRDNRHGELALIRSVFSEQYSNDVRSLVAVPVVAGNQTIGILSVNDVIEGRYAAKDVQLVSAFADLAALAIERDRFYRQSEQLAVMNERDRLARDLHDAVTQTLFSINLLADALPRIWSRDPEEGRKRLDEMRQMTRGALAEMRTLLLELRPASLTDADPGDLLRQLTESVTGRSQLPITLDIEGDCLHSPEMKIAIYRIAQEALNNVAKHARASHASVTLQFLPDQVKLCVSDDGRGFNPLAVPPERLGLAIMRDRADGIGAKLTIDSQEGRGTTVTVLWQKG